MQIYPDSQVVVDAITQTFAQQTATTPSEWVLAEPVDIREMPWSTLYFITFVHGGKRDKVVAKISHFPDQKTPEVSWTNPELLERGKREYESMVRVYEHFQQHPEAGLEALPPRAYVEALNAVVMSYVEFNTLYEACMATRTLFNAQELERGLEYVRLAGRWLRKLHRLPVNHIPVGRLLGPQDSVLMLLGEIQVLKEYGVDPTQLPKWEATLAVLRDMETDHLTWTHDDFHMRNVFVLPNGNVMSLDTALKHVDSPYLDIGKILADMKTRRSRVLRFGMLPSAGMVERFRQAFLDGYLDGEPLDPLLLALYEGRFLLQKWGESLRVIRNKLPAPMSMVMSQVPVNLVFKRMVSQWMDEVVVQGMAKEGS